MDIVDLIGCLSVGLKEDLWNPNFPVKRWEKVLLRWLIGKRGLATPIGYLQRNAYIKYIDKKGR